MQGLEKTNNAHGYMHQLSPIGQAFVDFSTQKPFQPMLDVGAAYGIASLPCLEHGAKVIATDIDKTHLQILRERAPSACRHLLSTVCAHFPLTLHLAQQSISAILIAHVLSFLTQQQLLQGFAKLHHWLVQGGKLFILNYTPYHKTLTQFIPVYEQRLQNKKLFSGYIQNRERYLDQSREPHDLPKQLMLLDKPTLEFLLKKNNFSIDYLEYIGGQSVGVPEPFCLDDREWVACIAIKK